VTATPRQSPQSPQPGEHSSSQPPAAASAPIGASRARSRRKARARRPVTARDSTRRDAPPSNRARSGSGRDRIEQAQALEAAEVEVVGSERRTVLEGERREQGVGDQRPAGVRFLQPSFASS